MTVVASRYDCRVSPRSRKKALRRELRQRLQQGRRSVMSAFPSIFGPDPVLIEATLAGACGKEAQEHEALLMRSSVRKVRSLADATTPDERLRCLRTTVLELLQVQRYALHLDLLFRHVEDCSGWFST